MNTGKLFFTLLPLLLLPGAAGVLSAADSITVAGPTTVKPVVDAAVAQYKKKSPGVDFVVGAGGSGQGIQLVTKGSVAIGMSSRPLTAAEKAQSPDVAQYQVGLDGIAMVAGKANAVSKLTRQQVQDIYAGKITNWKDLGGAPAPIVLYTMSTKHGTHDVFAEYFGLETNESGAGASLIASHRPKGEAAFLTNPNALGYVSIGIAAPVVQKGAPVRLHDPEGVTPTEASGKAATYPPTRPLLLLTKGEAKGKVREFIDFLCGPEGQAIVRQPDFIPPGI